MIRQLLSVFFMVTGIFVFMTGFHNIDLAINMDSGCLDTALLGEVRTKSEIYRMGVSQILLGNVFEVVAVFYSLFAVNKSFYLRNNN